MPKNYLDISWTYEYITSQDLTQFSFDTGINGDIYFTLSLSKYHQVNVVLTISQDNLCFFLTTDFLTRITYSSNLCRIINAPTSRPAQDCIENCELYNSTKSPLSMSEKYNLLLTDVADNEFGSISDALNKTTLAIQRTNRDFHGAGLTERYRSDANTGDLL
ncbi:unnamed protein product [Adineta ricciae]|uniref:Uncharacterized protein n=1 Tax=Adineta ricciae TaxID=249248 RepID=A0A814FT90_ADIRI|nr:unnamed protein product [Adineta ricciae]CAF1265476.1 unnamed protein product [Adineta ricciae]